MPGPLAALLLMTLIMGVVWALIVPPWQSPDENNHFAYVQTLAERGELPGAPHRPGFSSEQAAATDWSNADRVKASSSLVKPEWSSQVYRRFEQLPRLSRSDGGGPNPASYYPPLYYAYAAIAYRADVGGSIFGRLYAVRLWSSLLYLVTVSATWLLAGEVLGRRRRAQTIATAVVALEPMGQWLSASCNPDGMLFASWGLALWLGARILRRGLTMGNSLALGAVTAVALLTKATSYTLLPAVLLVLAVGAWRLRPQGMRLALAHALPGLAAFSLPLSVWLLSRSSAVTVATNPLGTGAQSSVGVSPRQFVSYLWKFYLPPLPGMKPFPMIGQSGIYVDWIQRVWATFGWLEVRLPGAVYGVLAGFTAFVVVGAAVMAWRRRRGNLALLAFFLVAFVPLLLALHWLDIRSILDTRIGFIQGRYLLPLLPLVGVAAAAAADLLPTRARSSIVALCLGGLVGLDLLSLGVVAVQFYA